MDELDKIRGLLVSVKSMLSDIPASAWTIDLISRLLILNDLGKAIVCDIQGYLGQLKRKTEVQNVGITQNVLNETSEKTSNVYNKSSRFECRGCSESFSQNADCLRHEIAVHNYGTFTCDICNKHFRKKGGLMSHKLIHTSKNEKPTEKTCKFCDRVFDTVSECADHISSHPQDRPFRCHFCFEHFAKKSTRENHEKSQHITAEDGAMSCKYCDKLIVATSDFDPHLLSHPTNKPYKCRSCTSHFRCPASRREHESKMHDGDRVTYECNECHRKYTKEESFKEHLLVHTHGKQYTCDECGLKYTSSQGLQAHIRRHRAKQHVCEICDERFTLSYKLRDHMRLHTGETPYQCKHCDKRFSSCELRYQHEASTHKPKNFECSSCGMRFMYLSLLKKHEKVHAGLKQHSCLYCGRGFSSRYGLDLHVRNKHTGEKPFVCQFCGAGFTSKAACKIHERIHTGERPYKCSVCDMRFNQISARKKHEKKHTASIGSSGDLTQKQILLENTQMISTETCRAGVGYAGAPLAVPHITYAQPEPPSNYYMRLLNSDRCTQMDVAPATSVNSSLTFHAIPTQPVPVDTSSSEASTMLTTQTVL